MNHSLVTAESGIKRFALQVRVGDLRSKRFANACHARLGMQIWWWPICYFLLFI